jgi:hypothetical protein
MTPADLDLHVHKEILKLRRIQHLLGLPSFRDAFDRASHEDKAKVARFTVSSDEESLKAWLEEKSDLSHLSIRELRPIARRVGIKDYGRLSKHQLVQELKDAVARGVNRKNTGDSPTPDGDGLDCGSQENDLGEIIGEIGREEPEYVEND